VLGGLAGFFAACFAPRPPRQPTPASAAPEPLKLDPIVDLVPAAGLVWLVDARPRALIEDPTLGSVSEMIVPRSRLQTFAERHGGLDVRATTQVAVAAYPSATLILGRLPFEPSRVEKAFGERVTRVVGRVVDRNVTRIWGDVPNAREQIALLAGEGVAFEHGQFGPLRAAVYFAQRRLRRSPSALHAEPLAAAASMLGDAPLRVFAPGPFEGEWARGAAGLLGASTAAGVAIRPTVGVRGGAVAMTLVLTGGWGSDAAVAAERLRSAFGVFAEDPLGLTMGMDHPVDGPSIGADANALRLDVTLDAAVLARGIHIAADASVDEIMAY
jgi:hypothetical protein